MTLLPVSPAGRRYGAFKSKSDIRDFTFSLLRDPIRGTTPPSSGRMNQKFCGPVRDQGSEGSCTGHAGYAMRMFLANKYEKNDNKVIFSPAEIYYLERKLDGTLENGDCGSTGRTCVKVLQQFGACPEQDDPYRAGDFGIPPSIKAIDDATQWRAGAYHRLVAVEEMKQCILSGYGFIVGFAVYSSFESSETARTGFMPVPNPNEPVLGGHEVFFVDYDDTVNGGSFLVQNSWGTGWGQDGYFWFPYICANNGVLFDAYIQHLGHAWKLNGAV